MAGSIFEVDFCKVPTLQGQNPNPRRPYLGSEGRYRRSETRRRNASENWPKSDHRKRDRSTFFSRRSERQKMWGLARQKIRAWQPIWRWKGKIFFWLGPIFTKVTQMSRFREKSAPKVVETIFDFFSSEKFFLPMKIFFPMKNFFAKNFFFEHLPRKFFFHQKHFFSPKLFSDFVMMILWQLLSFYSLYMYFRMHFYFLSFKAFLFLFKAEKFYNNCTLFFCVLWEREVWAFLFSFWESVFFFLGRSL